MMEKYELIIIGAGPSGMTAGIYAKRAGINTLLIEAGAPGGKLVKTDKIENYPGVGPMSRADLAIQMYEQTQSFDLPTVFADVKALTVEGDKKIIKSANGDYECQALIIATGTKERLMNIPGEEEFTGKGVSYCAVCDGFFFRNKKVAVIGGGNSALQEALYLTQFVSSLYLIIRRDVFRADRLLVEKVLKEPKINIIKKELPLAVEGQDKVERLILENVDTHEHMTLEVDGIFPYIGSLPCTEFVGDLPILDERGYIVVNADMETAVSGIYAAGDCTAKYLRQVITACGDGAIAAQKAASYLRQN